jgi:hypothetical protein
MILETVFSWRIFDKDHTGKFSNAARLSDQPKRASARLRKVMDNQSGIFKIDVRKEDTVRDIKYDVSYTDVPFFLFFSSEF